MKCKKLLFLFLILLLPFAVYGEDKEIDTSKKCSITGTYTYDDDVLVNVNTKIYKIADLKINAAYTYVDTFKDFDKDINSLATSEYIAYAKSISEYIKENNIKELASSSTDKEGKFYYKNLDVGLYLIEVDVLQKGDYEYDTEPILVSTPNRTYLYEDYSYDIVTLVKGSKNKIEDKGVPNTEANLLNTTLLVLSVLIIVLVIILVITRLKGEKENEKKKN